MHAVRDLNGVLVVSLALESTPSASNLAENLASVSDKFGVRNGKFSNPVIVVEWTSERAVEEVARVGTRGSGPGCVHITGLFSNEGEDVGPDVPAAKSAQVPVCFNSADLRVVVVVLRISGANQLLWNRITEKDTEDTVLDGVCVGLIESDQNKGVVHEMVVVKKRLQKATSPGTSSCDTSIMAIVCHVRRDKLKELSALHRYS